MASRRDIDIRRATRAELPRIAHLYLEASRNDNAYKRFWKSSEEFLAAHLKIFEAEIDDPTFAHFVAVDVHTHKIVATACWNLPSSAQIAERDKKYRQEKKQMKAIEDQSPGPIEPGAAGPSSFELFQGLGTFVDKVTDRWTNEVTSGIPHMVLQGMFTDPNWQNKGIGTELVKIGNELADKHGLISIVQASAFGWRVYERQGFKVQQTLDIDIRRWIKYGMDDDKGYGNYRFRFMVRLPNKERS